MFFVLKFLLTYWCNQSSPFNAAKSCLMTSKCQLQPIVSKNLLESDRFPLFKKFNTKILCYKTRAEGDKSSTRLNKFQIVDAKHKWENMTYIFCTVHSLAWQTWTLKPTKYVLLFVPFHFRHSHVPFIRIQINLISAFSKGDSRKLSDKIVILPLFYCLNARNNIRGSIPFFFVFDKIMIGMCMNRQRNFILLFYLFISF